MDVVVATYKVNFGPQLPHFLFYLSKTKQLGYTRKEDLNTVSYSYTMERREPSSHGLNVSPINMNDTIYTMRGNLA